ALVFRGDDGLDELTTATTSSVWVVRDGEVAPDRLDPAALGIAPSAADDLRGGSPAVNADVFRRVLAGERGPVRDAVLLNAGAAARTGSTSRHGRSPVERMPATAASSRDRPTPSPRAAGATNRVATHPRSSTAHRCARAHASFIASASGWPEGGRTRQTCPTG